MILRVLGHSLKWRCGQGCVPSDSFRGELCFLPCAASGGLLHPLSHKLTLASLQPRAFVIPSSLTLSLLPSSHKGPYNDTGPKWTIQGNFCSKSLHLVTLAEPSFCHPEGYRLQVPGDCEVVLKLGSCQHGTVSKEKVDIWGMRRLGRDLASLRS